MPIFHQRTAYLRWLAKRRRGPHGDPGGEGDPAPQGIQGLLGPAGPGLKTFRATGTTDASGNVTFNMSAASFAAAPVVAATLQASVTGATDVRVTALSATSCTINVRQAAGISVALLGLTLLGVPAALPGVTVHFLAAPAGAQA